MDLADRSTPEIRDLAETYYGDHGWDDIEALPETAPNDRKFKVEVWARKAVAEDDLPARLDYLRDLARDDDGRVRESVAMALKYVNDHAFVEVELTWRAWVTDENNDVRRACEVGLMGVPSAHVDAALGLFDHLVSDDDDYVKKNCGAFALSHVAKKDPETARAYLDRWSESDNLRTRWNVAKTIGGGYGRTSDYALTLAHRLAADDAYRVRQATAASLRNLIDSDTSVCERVEAWDDRAKFLSQL